jgi:hypothetical protein
MYERSPIAHVAYILFVEPRGLARHQPRAHLYADRAQVLEAFARNERIRVFYRRDNSPDASFDESIRAWRRATVMSVRLKRNVGGRSARLLCGLFERERLCVLDAFIKIEAFSYDAAIVCCYDAAYERTRTDKPRAARSQSKSAVHHQPVKFHLWLGV